MPNKTSPGRKSRRRPNKKNSPIRPKTRVRTLETAIDEAGKLDEPTPDLSLDHANSAPDERQHEAVAGKKLGVFACKNCWLTGVTARAGKWKPG